ncbi:low molecular weight protein-tyrosine-phosphatase [Chitinivorax sp. B]|uniref:low molecular weight protein-tyrosine-phosphatase n=1 Tax=Chitinivorax sp. B TaxID=2502235 RepID=UPI0010FA3CE0|nr:low molecular weight protein-tyrosine-phosphatase [Chitinivorax sp. B]
MSSVSVLFVCMGNICRSPTAEGVFRYFVETAGLAKRINIDSAGTHGYHAGEAPDPRSSMAAARRGYDLSRLRARQVKTADFEMFDLVLAMDEQNLRNLQRLCSPAQQHKLKLFLEYARNFDEREVPDPYYGSGSGFEHVLDLVEDASAGLLTDLRKRLANSQS